MKATLLDFSDDPLWILIPKELIGTEIEVIKILFQNDIYQYVTQEFHQGKYLLRFWFLKKEWLDFTTKENDASQTS